MAVFHLGGLLVRRSLTRGVQRDELDRKSVLDEPDLDREIDALDELQPSVGVLLHLDLKLPETLGLQQGLQPPQEVWLPNRLRIVNVQADLDRLAGGVLENE